MNARPTFRFAPSPNGELHIGHALSALTGWTWAQRFGGRFLLRIEDIDVARARPHFVNQIFSDLAWLGIRWEEPVLHQSAHFDHYRSSARRLQQLGLLYPCFATRREILDVASRHRDHPVDPDGAPLYPGLHRNLAADEVVRRMRAGQPHAWRIDMEKALAAVFAATGGRAITYCALDARGAPRTEVARPERWGDAIIVRKDVPGSYHLSVVTDDAMQGITHVTRGSDLEAATCLHRLLQVLLGLPAPLYHHHRLLRDEAGRKLSKSEGAISLSKLRQRGMTRADILSVIGPIEVPEPHRRPA